MNSDDKMTEDIKKLIAYLKYLNIPIDVNNSKDRFKLQKIAFLIKSMGIRLKYEFDLYLYGVYSQELYIESFESKNDFIELKSDYQINEDERIILEKLKENLTEDNRILEATTTIIYKDLVYEDIDKVINEIKEIKPHLSEDEILEGINLAKRLLFKEEYLTDEIKKELELWDNID